MKFTLAVYGAPYSSQGAHTAYQFARAALAAGHQLHRVFFYHDGIHNGSALAAPPQDEPNLPRDWQQLADEHGVDLVVCIAASVRRGLLDENEAKRYDKGASNLAPGFEISGLGQLLEATVHSDRTLTFGR